MEQIARYWRLALSAATLTVLAAASCLATPVDDFNRLKAEGKVAQAAEALRKEIRKPQRTNDPDRHNTNVRQLLLHTLGEVAALEGVRPALDEEARQLYEDGMTKFARGNAEHAAVLANGMAIYYSKSFRNGLALPYFQREFIEWQRLGNRYRGVLALDGIAKCYWDMGESDLYRYFLLQLLEAGASYFEFGVRPTDVNEWGQYANVLSYHMDFVAQTGDSVLLETLWERFEPIEARYWGNGALTGFRGAEIFALSGDGIRARAMLARADELWRTAPLRADNKRVRELGDLAQVCSTGGVRLALSEYEGAIGPLEACLTDQAKAGVKESDVALQNLLGRAYEGAGKIKEAAAAYSKAIDAAEGMRSSFSVSERARVFRTSARLPYWGQMRLQARAATGGDANAFFAAMHTSELVRGRQLGELLDPEETSRVTPERLRQLQSRLPQDAIVLAYTLTDTEVIVLAMTREDVVASVGSYDARRHLMLARTIARNLAVSKSAVSQLTAPLIEFSHPFIAPVRSLLHGHKHIIVLPDGAMNLIPFDVISIADEEYRPLIEDFTISASPSLLFIEHAERRRANSEAKNLLALGDPIYAKPQTLAGLSLSQVQAARGSGYLANFQPLPETRTEVEAIATMFGDQKVALLVGAAATESQIKTLDLSQFGYLHFATHGILGGDVPGIAGPALVLGSESAEDGFLTSSEVSLFKLDAELTVLSACNTGRGEVITGEGVMGMSRAFLEAGSRSVVVSLWPVASKQTEHLMVDFYRKLRGGLPAAEALRAAKLEMVARARKANAPESHPFFWAPFILLGG